MYDSNVISSGTGFVAKGASGKWYLITNRHNLTGRRQDDNSPLSPTGAIPNRIRIFHSWTGGIGLWRAHEEELLAGGKPAWREHPVLGAKADFVALPLTDLDEVALYPYDPLHPGPDIKVGPAEAVSVVGFPLGKTAGGFFGIWATGFVASEPEIDYLDLPVMLVDCRSRPGQSGSPVIAHRSAGSQVAMENGDSVVFNGNAVRFLGIYSGRIHADSDIGMVWKASSIAQLLKAL
ncbi:trypsin-like peptidase domain-containing protein [Mitsuaria sp. TWR114]|uniref:trypsin-like peptidase domain-containing protein n=1 Tax=Mitsuaria sp. TWR114 TaxID=2601731 RepID=UPI001C9A7BA7|nr:trypsin-like peptidase domain-containing protein [Mitsuaria sp. TWR114]